MDQSAAELDRKEKLPRDSIERLPSSIPVPLFHSIPDLLSNHFLPIMIDTALNVIESKSVTEQESEPFIQILIESPTTGLPKNQWT